MPVEAEVVRVLARSAGLDGREVRRYLRREVITVGEGPADPALVRRLRKAHRLHRDLGLSLDAIAIILRLLDRIEALEGTSQPHQAVRVTTPGPPGSGPQAPRTQ